MAARLNRHHSEEIRQKIQASVIIDRLTKHINGELEMTATQIAAANTLLDRSVPKLSQVQHVGDSDADPIKMTTEILIRAIDADRSTAKGG
jgi:hypothetical protein